MKKIIFLIFAFGVMNIFDSVCSDTRGSLRNFFSPRKNSVKPDQEDSSEEVYKRRMRPQKMAKSFDASTNSDSAPSVNLCQQVRDFVARYSMSNVAKFARFIPCTNDEVKRIERIKEGVVGSVQEVTKKSIIDPVKNLKRVKSSIAYDEAPSPSMRRRGWE